MIIASKRYQQCPPPPPVKATTAKGRRRRERASVSVTRILAASGGAGSSIISGVRTCRHEACLQSLFVPLAFPRGYATVGSARFRPIELSSSSGSRFNLSPATCAPSLAPSLVSLRVRLLDEYEMPDRKGNSVGKSAETDETVFFALPFPPSRTLRPAVGYFSFWQALRTRASASFRRQSRRSLRDRGEDPLESERVP